MTLNLKSDAGKDIFKSFLISSDVVDREFSNRDNGAYGAGYEELKKIKPNLIYAAISGLWLYRPL